MNIPRVVIAGLSGGTGKTTVSLGLTRAFARRGLVVSPFKKGPDYIDTAWLGLAAARTAGNLDPFFLDEPALLKHFGKWSSGAELALIEGNRGFFDGRDLAGSCSTAELARQLDAPVLLVVDCTKMTRTTAALVAGCKEFPGGKRIAGVILNRSGGKRHAALARQAVEALAGVPVLGVLPRLDAPPIVERREGLVTIDMHEAANAALDRIADFVAEHVDIEAALAVAAGAPPLPKSVSAASAVVSERPARIGVARDAALWQYYAENLEALREAGATLEFVSLLDDAPWPELDGLYLGGGDLAPYAARLSAGPARSHVAHLAASGLPIYAEQAGFFFLGESYATEEGVFPMAGVFPIRASSGDKPGSLGYVEALVTGDSPFFPAQCVIRGHAFYYGTVDAVGEDAFFERRIGADWGQQRDGLLRGTVFGACMQIFAPGVPGWAHSFVRAAAARRALA